MPNPACYSHVLSISLTDAEYNNLLLLVVSSDRLEITSVEELISFHVEFLVENAFLTVKEPKNHG